MAALERCGDLYLYCSLATGLGATMFAAALKRDEWRRRELELQFDQQLAAARERARAQYVNEIRTRASHLRLPLGFFSFCFLMLTAGQSFANLIHFYDMSTGLAH